MEKVSHVTIYVEKQQRFLILIESIRTKRRNDISLSFLSFTLFLSLCLSPTLCEFAQIGNIV